MECARPIRPRDDGRISHLACFAIRKYNEVYFKRSIWFSSEVTTVNIAVCDDEQTQNEKIAGYISTYRQTYPDLSVSEFLSGGELLHSCETGYRYDFVFLDIQMQGADGVETARQLRAVNSGVLVIFISSFTKYVSSAFRRNAFQFLIKPVGESEFRREFDRAVQVYYRRHHKYIIGNQEKTEALEIGEILYIEGYHRYLSLQTRGQVYDKIGKLNDEEKRLAPLGFVRIHQGFFVNMAFIKTLESESIQLADGKKLPMSARKKPEALRAFHRYLSGCAL